MLALLKDTDNILLQLFWGISAMLLASSVFICLVLFARRIYKNRHKIKSLKQQSNFESALKLALTDKLEILLQDDLESLEAPDFNFKSRIIYNEILLKYFRTLNGKRADALRHLTESKNFEPQIRQSTKKGTVGRRMEAMRILSYLNTQTSLLSIHDGLSSGKKYIRLTAARCLTRRNAQVFLDDIIFSINEAFPDEEHLLADILFRFGPNISPTLEAYVSNNSDNCIKAAALEALILMMPAKVSLDLERLLENPDERVRSAAIALANITQHNSQVDLLSKGLTDSSVKVKIRSAKIAYEARRIDTISKLHHLAQDPFLWVRYWAVKAIWNTGRQGKKFVETIGEDTNASGKIAREVALESQNVNINFAS